MSPALPSLAPQLFGIPAVLGYIYISNMELFRENTVGSRFATVRFTTIHFYDTCRVGPRTPRPVVRHCRNSSALSVLSALLDLFRCACVSTFSALVQLF